MYRLPGAPRLLTVSLALVLVVSCGDPVCGCLSAARAVVYGRVTDPAGAGVAGALVATQQSSVACDPAGMEETGFARTTADGRYRLQMRTGAPPLPDGCLRAFADPPAQSTLRGSDTVPFTVEMDYAGPMDSVRVDLVLRAP
jgi:hypothetical protein